MKQCKYCKTKLYNQVTLMCGCGTFCSIECQEAFHVNKNFSKKESEGKYKTYTDPSIEEESEDKE